MVRFRPASFFSVFRVVGAVEKASLEELDRDDGEDKMKEHVDDHDVDNILERVDDAVEHRLRSHRTIQLLSPTVTVRHAPAGSRYAYRLVYDKLRFKSILLQSLATVLRRLTY